MKSPRFIKINDAYVNPEQVTMVFVQPEYPFMTCIRLACGGLVVTEQSYTEVLDRLSKEGYL